ncbi:hypothetical protein GCM10009743_12690 [Kribbella swartbergensis]
MRAVPDGWTKAIVQVSAGAATMETQLSIERLDGSVEVGASIDAEAQMACDDLRDEMYEDGRARGTTRCSA